MSTVTQSIIIDRKLLAGAVSRIAGLANERGYKPILRYLRLRDSAPDMTLAATNLECYAEIALPTGRAELSGADLLLPAKELHQILALCDGPNVEIEQTDNGVRITSERARWTLATENPEQFPTPQVVDSNKTATVQAAALRHALTIGVPFCAEHKTYAMGGIRLEGDGRSVFAIASDGKCMSAVEFPAIGELGECLIPESTARHFLRLLPEDGEVTLTIDQNNIEAAGENAKIIGRQLEGRYPRWRDTGIQDKGKDGEFDVPASQLLLAMQRAAFATSDVSRAMSIRVADGTAAFSCREVDGGREADSEIPIASDSRVSSCINPRYAIDFLRNCGDQTVEVSFRNDQCVRIFAGGAKFMVMTLATDR